MALPLCFNNWQGAIYPEQATRVEGLPFDPSTPPPASLGIVVSERTESNHDFAQGKCALGTYEWGRI